MTSEVEAVESLKTFGLTEYEAKVFIALQKLGTGTARDVSGITEVPRPQVYSTAEKLEERGLINVEQSRPLRYRAVDLEEAQERLAAQLDRDRRRAFGYLERARGELEDDTETQEAVWTVRGTGAITDRIDRLVGEATSSVVLYVRDDALMTDAVATALRDAASSGIATVVVSEDARTRGRFEGSGVSAVAPPETTPSDEPTGRVAVIDWSTLLLSVLDTPGDPAVSDETAIWSTDTGFATILTEFTRRRLADVLPEECLDG